MMVVSLGQQCNNNVGEKPTVIIILLYTFYIINRHAGTPNKTKQSSFLCVVSGQRGTIAKSMHEEHLSVVALTSMDRGTQFFPLASYLLV